jgi:hypothetical protein
LGLSSHWLFCNSHGWLSTPHNNWGLARQLHLMFFYGGGWAAAGSSRLSHRILVTFVPLLYRVERRNLLQVMESRRQHTQHRDTSTRLPYSRKLTSWDVVSMTLSFLATRLRAMLRGFLGGAGKLASKLVGGS